MKHTFYTNELHPSLQMCLIGYFPIPFDSEDLKFCFHSYCTPCYHPCRLAKESRTVNTEHYHFCVAKDSGSVTVSWAFHIYGLELRLSIWYFLFFLFLFLGETYTHQEVVTSGKFICQLYWIENHLGVCDDFSRES